LNGLAVELSAPCAAAGKLGHAGLLPFVAGAALVWFVTAEAHPYVVLALAAYAALIVSFLGGIHWGLAMRSATALPPMPLLLWGVSPSLLAWPALLMPPSAGLPLLGLLLVVCYVVDRKLYPRFGAGAWLGLRFRLSAVAAISCFVAAAGA
jgi:hypothetical protein